MTDLKQLITDINILTQEIKYAREAGDTDLEYLYEELDELLNKRNKMVHKEYT